MYILGRLSIFLVLFLLHQHSAPIELKTSYIHTVHSECVTLPRVNLEIKLTGHVPASDRLDTWPSAASTGFQMEYLHLQPHLLALALTLALERCAGLKQTKEEIWHFRPH